MADPTRSARNNKGPVLGSIAAKIAKCIAGYIAEHLGGRRKGITDTGVVKLYRSPKIIGRLVDIAKL
jgi:hypothetical protein